MPSFPNTETTMIFPGPIGQLELLITPHEDAKGTAIICHPHPLFGGTMHNKVVTTLARTFKDLGLNTVRFNFRGVGKSEGVHDEGRGEVADLVAIANWVKTSLPGLPIWLAGFSFGAYVAAQGVLEIKPEQLITIAPMVSRFKSNPETLKITCPWVLVQGEEDEVISPQEVFDWVKTLDPKPVVVRMPGAGHFFHGQLLGLRNKLISLMGHTTS